MKLKVECLICFILPIFLVSCATPSRSYVNEDENRAEFFGGFKNKCDALVAWVWPLKTQFPTLTSRKANEKTQIHVYKHLFNDDNFIPTFGVPFDALASSQKRSVAKALRHRKECKHASKEQLDYFKGLYTNQFLPGTFNKKLSPIVLDEEFVIDHLVRRRTALASVGVLSGERPDDDHLIKLAKTSTSIFDLLWPSERELIETRLAGVNIAPQLDGDRDVIGSWYGYGQCSKRSTRFNILIKAQPGRIAAEMKAGFRKHEFSLSRRENGVYLITGGQQQLGQNLSLIRSEDMGSLITIDPTRGCGRVMMAKFEPIDGLSGYYNSVSNQQEFCSIAVTSWLEERKESEEIATLLQIELYPLLQSYDPSLASNESIFGSSVLKKVFGDGIETLDEMERRALAKQIFSCLLLEEKVLQHSGASSLYDLRVVQAAKLRAYSSSRASDISHGQTAAYQRFIKNGVRADDQTTTDDVFPEWRTVALGASAQSDLENMLKRKAATFESYEPATLKKILDPISVTLNQLRLAKRHENTEQQRERYQRMLQRVTIPYGQIPDPFKNQVRQLARGEPVSLDSASLLFFGGYASHAMKKCTNALTSSQRYTVSEFLLSSVLRAGIGPNFSEPNISTALAGQGTFAIGRTVSQSVGCSVAEPLLTFVHDMVEGSRNSIDGRPSVFVRSCASSFNERQCSCLAKAGEAALPGINKMRYSRNVIPSIISRNPIAGARVIAQCGIERY